MKSLLKGISLRNCASTRTPNGTIPNQFIIKVKTKKGTIQIFRSYQTNIVMIDEHGQTWIDPDWKHSNTTGKYRNQFLGENYKETQAKLDSGEYKMADLNK